MRVWSFLMIRLEASRHEAILCDFTQCRKAKRGGFLVCVLSAIRLGRSQMPVPDNIVPTLGVTGPFFYFPSPFSVAFRLSIPESSVVSNGLIMKFLGERDLRAD